MIKRSNETTNTRWSAGTDIIKVAVLGAGGWGANLIRTFHNLGALGAVVEIDPDKRSAVASQYPGLTILASPEQLWRGQWPAVVIATPAPTHYELARQALLAGKDVFVEKPMTLISGEAEDLVKLAREYKRILMVGHLLMYQPAIQWIKNRIGEGLIGRVASLHQERLNLGRVRSVENALWSLGVHDVAVLLFLVGEAPHSVRAFGQRVLQPAVEDDVYVTLEFRNDVVAHLHCSWLWPEKRRRLTIIGTRGMLVYDELEQTVTLHRKHISPDLVIRDDGAELVFVGEGEPLTVECQHFLDAVRTRSSPFSDGESGLQVVRVLEDAQRLLEEQFTGTDSSVSKADWTR